MWKRIAGGLFSGHSTRLLRCRPALAKRAAKLLDDVMQALADLRDTGRLSLPRSPPS
jgi:hypothetical protein